MEFLHDFFVYAPARVAVKPEIADIDIVIERTIKSRSWITERTAILTTMDFLEIPILLVSPRIKR